MADTTIKNGPLNRQWRTPVWLKRADWFFVEHLLFLFFAAILLWLFDGLVFGLFEYLALSPADRFAAPGALVFAIPAVFVVVPFLLVLWRRQRGSLDAKPALALRKAHRWPLYAFVVVQILTIFSLAISLVGALVGPIMGSGPGPFGQQFLTLVLPAVFAIAAHSAAVWVMSKQDGRLERSLVVNLSLGVVVGALVLLAVLAGTTGQRVKTNPQTTPFDPAQNRSYYNY